MGPARVGAAHPSRHAEAAGPRAAARAGLGDPGMHDQNPVGEPGASEPVGSSPRRDRRRAAGDGMDGARGRREGRRLLSASLGAV